MAGLAKKDFIQRVRPVGDTEWWNTFTRPLVIFLSEWRTWSELVQWRIENGVKDAVLTNAVAYLYIHRKVRYHVASKKWGPRSGLLPDDPRPVKKRKRTKAQPIPSSEPKERTGEEGSESHTPTLDAVPPLR
jgi:hypothetical protein